jgi:hypothetical protein
VLRRPTNVQSVPPSIGGLAGAGSAERHYRFGGLIRREFEE